tara:strand:+ start:3343 stop:3756 length:414 start_codon:yes stop_codon:yes gene_type:complete
MNYNTDAQGNNAPIEQSLVETIVANKTLNYEDSGSKILVATDALVISLPATKKGVEYTIINTGADGNNIITVSPVAADGIAGVITLAGSVVARAGTVNVDLVNTKATSKVGSAINIVGTGVAGVTAWIITGSTGIWA